MQALSSAGVETATYSARVGREIVTQMAAERAGEQRQLPASPEAGCGGESCPGPPPSYELPAERGTGREGHERYWCCAARAVRRAACVVRRGGRRTTWPEGSVQPKKPPSHSIICPHSLPKQALRQALRALAAATAFGAVWLGLG